MGVTDTGFLSCAAIRTGFNFYRSGKVTACCHGIDAALEIARGGNRDDVQAMISTAAAHGVRHLALSLDFGIPPARHEEYREPVALFVRLAAEAGLKIVADFLPVSLRPVALNQR